MRFFANNDGRAPVLGSYAHRCRHIQTAPNNIHSAIGIMNARAFQGGIGFEPGLECLG
jgi:hypothetical protein